MKKSTVAAMAAFILLAAYTVRLEFVNADLRCSLENRSAPAKRCERPKVRMPPRPAGKRPVRPAALPVKAPAKAVRIPPQRLASDRREVAADATDAAERLARRRREAAEERARRRAAIEALTPEQKEAQREAFITKMRERSTRRLSSFVSNTGLSTEQTESFEGMVAALDASLRDTAAVWAERIRADGAFSRESQVKFTGEVAELLGAGYGEMDATLPETWRTDDGNVNLMEIVGPEALAPVVEALTESGLEDGLQTIGQIMGGPSGEGGEGMEGGQPPPEAGGMEGIESPGVGNGPGGAGGPGGGFAPPAAR